MRSKKASINVLVNLITYILGFLPIFIVRRVFLTSLGEDLLGLSSIYANIIGLLSIVELGIGTAIIYALYKPFADNDRVKIKGYLNYYAKFYRIVGVIILISGICILPLLKLFIKDQINIGDAKIYFLLFLLNTLISYLFSYKTSMLYVSQEAYKISILNTFTKVIIAVLQIISLKLHSSFIEYLIIQFVLNLLYYIALNKYIDRKFSWLKNTKGELNIEEKNSLGKNMKALFLHKIGGLIVLSTDNLLISSFLSLNIVTKFNSYYFILSSAQSIIVNTISGVTASIGNLLTEGDRDNAYNVHKKLFFLNFWIASFVSISLFNTVSQLIIIWLGKDQVLDGVTISLLILNLYFMIMRSSVESFKEAGGIYYQDRYSSLLEGAVNLIFSLILVNYIGLPGVFLGTLISNVCVVFIIKPKVVYKHIFNKPVKVYFKTYFKYLLIAIIPFIATYLLTYEIKQKNTISAFIINCIINIVVINLLYIIIFLKNKEFLYFKKFVIEIIKKVKIGFLKKRNIYKIK